MKQESTKSKLSVRALYVWSLCSIVVGLGLLLWIRYKTATTFCSIGDGCETVTTIGNIGRPIGAILLWSGAALLIGNTIRYFTLRRKR